MSSNINLSAVIRENNGTRLIGSTHVFQTFGSTQSSNLSLSSLIDVNSNVTALTVTGQNIIVGANTSYASYKTSNNSLILPSASGTINGVNITALNQRTRTSYAAARDCVNNFTLRYSSNTITSLKQVCWSSELSLFVAITDNNILTSPDGITWTVRTSPDSDRFWNSICWSPQLSLFVAIEYSSYYTTGDNIMTSSDGINWTLRTWTGSTTIRWSSICWSPELMLFVVVGDDIRTSPNGINWTVINNPISNTIWQSICWSSELAMFVAVGFRTGYGGVTMTSKNGILWSAYTTTSPSNYICWSPELLIFVAVSANSYSIMTSYDGFTWTTRVTPENYGLKSFCWSPELQIFIGCASTDYSDSLFSQDGINWILTTNDVYGYTLNSFCWSPELSIFVTIGSYYGSSANILTSGIGMPNAKSVLKVSPSQMSILSDGNVKIGTGYISNSNRLILPSATGNINSINITALNKRTHSSYFSTLACVKSWTSRTSVANNNWTSVCWSSGLSLFVAVASTGTGNGIMTSPDGITWTARTPRADNAWTSICYSTDTTTTVLVAVASSGTGNRVMMSADGIDWSYGFVSPADNNWTSVCWSPELDIFVAVANSGTGNRVMTGDYLGITWTLQASAADNNWTSVCWSPELSLFVAVANSGTTGSDGVTSNRIMTSPDGITWTIRTSPASASYNSVCWSPELSIFVAVASTGTYRIMTSSDGITWTRYSSGTTYALYSVCWSPELSIFVATSTNAIRYSIDGITWNTASASNVWSSVCWSPELSTFVAVSNTGTGNRVMTSAIGMPNAKSVVKALPSQVTVLPSGNVGIGITAPGYKLEVAGDLVVSGSVSAGALNNFKNGLINGGMQISQRGIGGGSYDTSTLNYTLDRWACATTPGSGTLAAGQVALSAADRATTGQINAAAIGPAPSAGLVAYFPFDSNVTDASGNGVTLTSVGTMQYVSGRVGSNAVYLANENNVLASPTAAANVLTCASYVFPTIFTISMYVMATKVAAITNCFFSTNAGTGNLANTLMMYFSSGNLLIFGIQNVVGGTGPTVTTNTWYHVALTYNNGYFQWFVNGTIYNTYTGTFVQSGFMFGNQGTTFNYPFAGFIDDFRIYNRALSASEIAALANIAPIQVAPATTLASGLTTRLTFDNVTTDTQGTLAAPTQTGTPTYSSASKSGTACLNLMGNTAGNTTTTTALSYGFTTNTLPLTVSLWLNTNTVSTVQVPIGCTLGISKGFHFVVNNNGTLYFSAFVGGTEYAVSSISISANTWIFLTATVLHSNRVTLYVNGNQASLSSVLPASGTLGAVDTLRIGSTVSANNNFKGFIDDVRIYNRALAPTEVAGLYYSYQPAPYALFQQPIEGLNIADLGWGTSAAQSAAVSCWIKNNTSNAQQFTLSAGNAGAAAAITAITFESGIDDTLGFLTNSVGTNVAYSTSVYKVGTQALDLTANMAGSSTFSGSSSVTYASIITIPFAVSLWLRANVVNTVQIPLSFAPNTNILQLVIHSDGQVYLEVIVGGTQFTTYSVTPSTATIISANTWYHVSFNVSYNTSIQLYINGVPVASTSTLPSSATYNASLVSLGGRPPYLSASAYMFKGYLDDVRIYNRALTASEVYQLYATNASFTTISQYLLPRSYLYTTPSIAAGTWQKITFTIPGDTTDAAWATNTTCGINLALCLGAGGSYISTETSGWSSAKYFTGASVQTFGGSSNNFLAGAGNNILLTGVQLEKGSVATPFDVRPFASELQLCQRYYEKSYSLSVPPGSTSTDGAAYMQNPTAGNMYLVIKYKNTVRTIPTITTYDNVGNINKINNSLGANQTPSISRIGENSVIIGDNGSVTNISFHYVISAEL